MTLPTDVDLLAAWMGGDFSNIEQATENPPFFAHIRVSIRSFYHSSFPAVGQWLYLEQAYNYALHQPYRTAVFHLYYTNDHISLDNYKVLDAARFIGASRQPSQLEHLTFDIIERQVGCSSSIHRTEKGTFFGKIEPGKRCLVLRDGKPSYLLNEFEVSETRYTSLDRGLDPVTDQRVWGSVAGPFEFVKQIDYPVYNR